MEAELERSTRSLVDVLVDEGRQGSNVRLETLAGDVEGTIDHVGVELTTIDTGGGAVAVGLDTVTALSVTREGDSAHRVTRGHPESLLATARELASRGATVELGRPSGLPLAGTIVAAGPSHVELETIAGACFVPVSAICWLRTLD